VIENDLNLTFTIKTSHPCGKMKEKEEKYGSFNPLSAYVLTDPSCGDGI
jgi:hypothetical protein